MIQELRTQRDDIVHARDVMDSRRRFTEAVLSGASAGVIGVDSKGNVRILNRSAEKLIGRTENEALGQSLTEVLPELVGTMAAVQSGASPRIRSPSAETIANAIYRCALQRAVSGFRPRLCGDAR